MMTVNETAKLSGVSVRTLHHYDRLGLLKPARVTEAGYRLYDEESLERLQTILLFRELQFPLKEIKAILDSPDFDRNKALRQQVQLLTLKKEHLENLILLAKGLQLTGVKYMDFKAFDTRQIDDYVARAKASWGQTDAWQEFEQKHGHRSREEEKALGEEMFRVLGRIAEKGDPSRAHLEVKALQDFVTRHYYTCTDEILAGLGRMYAGGGEFTENIDRALGEGAAHFCHEAIESYLAAKACDP